MPSVKLPRLVYIMIAVVITLVFQAIAPPTMATAPTSAMARAKLSRYAEKIEYRHSLTSSRYSLPLPKPRPLVVSRRAGAVSATKVSMTPMMIGVISTTWARIISLTVKSQCRCRKGPTPEKSM